MFKPVTVTRPLCCLDRVRVRTGAVSGQSTEQVMEQELVGVGGWAESGTYRPVRANV